jgi:glucose-6-phosphate 1-epimerase
MSPHPPSSECPPISQHPYTDYALSPQLFGTSKHEPVANLPQHGFARNSRWEFLGKSSTEGANSSVKLDFGLSSEGIDEKIKSLWPYKFGLLYSVTLEPESLTTALVITNDGDAPFEFQTLLHTYFRVQVSKLLSPVSELTD